MNSRSPSRLLIILAIFLYAFIPAACGNASSEPSSEELAQREAAATKAAELSIQAAVHATLAAQIVESPSSQQLESTRIVKPSSQHPQILSPTPTHIPPTVTSTPLPPTATPLPTNTPQPPNTPTLAPQEDNSKTFGPLRFCREEDFDQVTKRCTKSQNVFTGQVKIVYVSWEPSSDKKGSLFKRKWYLDDDEPFLITENANEYAYLAVNTRESLKPGSYLVELYIGDELVQTGQFVIK